MIFLLMLLSITVFQAFIHADFLCQNIFRKTNFILAKAKRSQSKDSIFKVSSSEKNCSRSIFCAIFSKHIALKIKAAKIIWPVKPLKQRMMQITAHQWFEVRSPFLSFFGVTFSFSFWSVHFFFTSTNPSLKNREGV